MTTEDYLSEVLECIKNNFRPNDPTGGMTAASAAYLIKNITHKDYKEFGFTKFKDVLKKLADAGKLRTGLNSKSAYSLWLDENIKPTAKPTQSEGEVRRLNRQVWFAFVGNNPPGERYINRLTGHIRIGDSFSPGESWIEITPISPSDEHKSAIQFLKENNLSTEKFESALEKEHWYVEFPRSLRNEDSKLATIWQRKRSQKVIDYVKKWCNENNVDQSFIFEESVPKQLHKSTQSIDQYNLREVLLQAIKLMPTDDLLHVKIPASALISLLRPDLLR
tara:strand:- start:6976 stop:7809 length:834 start_codon:yes stop_codon:yes gene_type:complete